jgi:mannose-1-phosphate guanylyltransferase
MKIIIFAGGIGSRLWPMSRKNSPKQFEKIFGNKSTLQETVERLFPQFKPEDIYVATGEHYEHIVREQLQSLPKENFIFEPEMRDVGPAIGLVASILEKKFPNEPVAILWSDHLVKNVDGFKKVLLKAETLVGQKNADFVFIGQKPRFANQNMGWIELGNLVKDIDIAHTDAQIYTFKQLCYRPSLEEAEKFFADKNFIWNLGYFVTTPSLLVSLYEKYVPSMSTQLKELSAAWGTPIYKAKLHKIYPTLEKISFDDAILVKLPPNNMYVISANLEWSDIGAWEALKEALASSVEENVIKGDVALEDSTDSLVYNFTDQLVVGLDLEEMLVINTGDVLLVCPKTAVPKIKKFVEGLAGTPHERLT